MLRLFSLIGLVIAVSSALALGTGSLLFRIIALGLAIPFALAMWYLRRSLPSNRGALNLPGLSEPVEVFTDDRGIPHIYAWAEGDLYLAQGYITARDRLWSMDLHRRIASGRLSEIIGTPGLTLDRHFRSVGLHRAAHEALAGCDPRTLACLEAFSAGVNARMAEGKRPPEFDFLGYRPDPWTPADSLMMAKYLAYGFAGNWAGQVFRAKLVQALGQEKAAELFHLPPDPADLQLLESTALPDLDELLAAAFRVQAPVGGTGWVLSGSRTKTGAPLLACDMQVPVYSPALWYQTHLAGPQGMDVTGATFAGIPGIVLGHNREIAWGIVNLHADVQDVCIERPNPSSAVEFAYEGGWEPARLIQEELHVRGQSRPDVLDVLVTRHGPVIARGDQAALSLRWTALQGSDEIPLILAINRARSWGEFDHALGAATSSLAARFLFAGRDGIIAARVSGAIPRRAKGDGQLPIPGWSRDWEWKGIFDASELPVTVNPPDGVITAASQESGPADFGHQLGAAWSFPYRSHRIHSRLRDAVGFTTEKMVELQADIVNLQAYSLRPVLLATMDEGLRQGAAAEPLSDLEKQALLMLSGWDCQEEPDSPGAALWHQWFLFLIEGIFRPQMGLTLFDQFLACGSAEQMTDRMVRTVSSGGTSSWMASTGEASLPRVALRALRRAVALLAAKQGQRPDRWRWGREHRVVFAHLLTQRRRFLRAILNPAVRPVPGSGATVHAMGYSPSRPFTVRTAASWRQVADLGQWDESRDICAPGQSGHPLSPHKDDQIAAWVKGDLYGQLFRHETIRKLPHLTLYPVGDPPPPQEEELTAAD